MLHEMPIGIRFADLYFMPLFNVTHPFSLHYPLILPANAANNFRYELCDRV